MPDFGSAKSSSSPSSPSSASSPSSLSPADLCCERCSEGTIPATMEATFSGWVNNAGNADCDTGECLDMNATFTLDFDPDGGRSGCDACSAPSGMIRCCWSYEFDTPVCDKRSPNGIRYIIARLYNGGTVPGTSKLELELANENGTIIKTMVMKDNIANPIDCTTFDESALVYGTWHVPCYSRTYQTWKLAS